MKPNFDISGQVVVITGAGGVLCGEISRQLAACGCKLAILDINEQAAQQVAQEIEATGSEAIAVHVDVLNKESLMAAKDKVLARFEHVDILVNGAGGNKPAATTNADQSFFDVPQDALQWVFNLNILGTIMTSQVFGELFAHQKYGNIINFSSMSAFTPLTRVLGYSAAKAGVNNFTQWLAVHMCMEYSTDIRVNAIAPGFLLTEQNRFLLTTQDGGLTQRGSDVLHHTPMGRFGKPEELVGAVVFLCSPAASFINGVVLPIDGGFSVITI